MIRDDILDVLQRDGKHTSTQIAMAINSSQGRVHNVLLQLENEGIISREVITADTPYNKTKTFVVWYISN